ncbi:MAG TPA: hypothetical protein VF316_14060 [Polyangiaceae bacterium]
MLALYLGALVVGLGALGLQVFGGHDSDTSMDHGGPAHDTDHGSPLLVLISLRFWAFGLLAFGLVGTLLLLFGFAGKWTSLAISAPFGAVSGFVAASVVRRLQQKGTTSQVTDSDIIGLIGRVLVPPPSSGQGKVRVRVKASYVDYVARAVEPLEEGDTVVVEEVEDGVVTVSRAPKELKA